MRRGPVDVAKDVRNVDHGIHVVPGSRRGEQALTREHDHKVGPCVRIKETILCSDVDRVVDVVTHFGIGAKEDVRHLHVDMQRGRDDGLHGSKDRLEVVLPVLFRVMKGIASTLIIGNDDAHRCITIGSADSLTGSE